MKKGIWVLKSPVLGWSDGGIEALLLGIRHPAKVKKIASMAANLEPSENAVHAEVIAGVKRMIAGMPANSVDTPQGRRELKLAKLMLDEPHIPLTALEAITVPTLILASDHDVIRDEHTVAIYRHTPMRSSWSSRTQPTWCPSTIRPPSTPPSNASSVPRL